jgi:hypothetical protein
LTGNADAAFRDLKSEQDGRDPRRHCQQALILELCRSFGLLHYKVVGRSSIVANSGRDGSGSTDMDPNRFSSG